MEKKPIASVVAATDTEGGMEGEAVKKGDEL